MKIRWVFFCGALMLLVCANGAYAGGGTFQRTKDGKALVWNNHRELGDEVTWSGARDSKGYATGEGKLTWYKVEGKMVTGSRIEARRGRSVFLSRYSGKMIGGKFDGLVVAVDAKGKTFHGLFANGTNTGLWVAGPAPTPPIPVEQPNESPATSAVVAAPAEGGAPEEKIGNAQADSAKAAATPERSTPNSESIREQAAQHPTAEPPAEGPAPETKPENTPPPETRSAVTSAQRRELAPGEVRPTGVTNGRSKINSESMREQAAQHSMASPAEGRPLQEALSRPVIRERPSPGIDDDAIRSLSTSPSASPAKSVAEVTPPPPTTPSPDSSARPKGTRLTRAEVIELANTEAHRQGYNPAEYQGPQANYVAAEETWSVSYDQMNADGFAKHLSVRVQDKTKKASIGAGK